MKTRDLINKQELQEEINTSVSTKLNSLFGRMRHAEVKVDDLYDVTTTKKETEALDK